MGQSITPRKLSASAQKTIQLTYLIGSAPADSHKLLNDMARSTSVFGEILQSLSDDYAIVGKKFASTITYTGKVFWGIVELSVPQSVSRYLLRSWLSLFALISVIIIAIGLLTAASGMSGAGTGMLIIVILLTLASAFLRYFMLKSRVPPRFMLLCRIGLGVVAVLLAAYLAVCHGEGVAEVLKHIEGFFRWSAHFKRYLWSSAAMR